MSLSVNEIQESLRTIVGNRNGDTRKVEWKGKIVVVKGKGLIQNYRRMQRVRTY